MAGSIRGRLDCKSAAGGATTTIQTNRNVQAMYATIYNFLANHPNVSLVANHYGNSASGTYLAPPTNTRGIGYWDESTNFGYDAFSVWYFGSALHPWYLFLELPAQQGSTLPNGSKFLGSTAPGSLAPIGMSAAWALNGAGAVASPWAGGTAKAGADARADGSNNRWTDPGGGVWVLPRSNNLYGDNTTNKANSTSLVRIDGGGSGTSLCYNIWADDDSFCVAYDANDANVWSVAGIFRVTPRASLTYPRPYLMLTQTGSLPAVPTSSGGSTTGAADGGGVIMPTGHVGSLVRAWTTDRYATLQANANFQPGNVSGSSLYEEWAIKIAANEASTTNSYGLLGDVDSNMLREAYNVVAANTNVGATRIYLGSATTAAYKYSLKWDGSTTPRTYAGANDAAKRVGVQGAGTATAL